MAVNGCERPMTPPDETLMGLVAGGDHGAFRQLVDRHVDRAVALAQRIVGSRAEAEEVVQEAFLRVWTTAPRWNPEGAMFRTWFSRVLTNLCIDRRRRPRHAALDETHDPPDERPNAAESLAADEEAGRVRAAMARLPDRQRAALALCYFDEMGNQEAATALGVTVGALESLLVRGRKALKDALQADLRGEGT
jgi:RNA polymerase sigma-70 factor (ECF subfamily)